MSEKHISVLLDETIDSLNLSDGSLVVDATLGYGGHSQVILQKIKRGHLFAFDQDSEAIRHSTDRLMSIGTNFTIVESNFKNIKNKLNELGVFKVNSIMFDLGVSSPELDDADRGFSYHKDAKLDMRMNQKQDFSAYELINEYTEAQLKNIFYKYGESKFSNSIAKKIVRYRENKKIENTLELVEIIKSSVPMKERLKKHPARQIFQAIRIEVNDELNVLKFALKEALDLLDVGGRLSVITFHSLEDKIVKKYFKEMTDINPLLKGMPNVNDDLLPNYKLITKKPTIPSEEEIDKNPRSRSAKLRVIERVK